MLLVSIKVHSLVISLPDPPVLPHEYPLHQPRGQSDPKREADTCDHCRAKQWGIFVVPEVRRIYEGQVTKRIDDGDSRGPLLIRLAKCRRGPGEIDIIDAVCGAHKDEHGKVASTNVMRPRCNGETENGDGFGYCNVPGPFVEVARRPRDGD